MRPTRHLERCPYLQQVLHSIGATWGRTRLMRLSGQAEVTPHVDVNYYWRERVRVHVPIVTQPTVRFTCGDAEINMRAGECWIFDTWRMHNVVNDHALPRIHLVADTVGGTGFWQLVARSRPHRARARTGSRRSLHRTRSVAAVARLRVRERARGHDALGDARAYRLRAQRGAATSKRCRRSSSACCCFVRDWHGAVVRLRRAPRGLADAIARCSMPRGAICWRSERTRSCSRNTVGLMQALDAWVFNVALADRRSSADPEVRQRPGAASAAPDAASCGGAVAIRVFDRPVFIVSPPRSGSTMLFETLARAPRLFTIGDESHQLIEGVPQLSPESRGFESNRLLAAGCDARRGRETLRRRFYEALRDREGQRPPPGAAGAHAGEDAEELAAGAVSRARVSRSALHLPVSRPAAGALEHDRSVDDPDAFAPIRSCPAGRGPAWSLLLVPGWRELIGRPLHEIVAAQWNAATRLLIDDLEALPGRALHDRALRRAGRRPGSRDPPVCARPLDSTGMRLELALRLSRYTVSAPDADKWRRHAAEIEAVLPSLAEQVARAERFAAR